METIILNDETQLRGQNCATIGFFDGVHRGHQYLLGQLRRMARERGQQSMVITFERHPREVLRHDSGPHLLTTLEEKRRLLLGAGIDCLVVLRFDAAFASLSALDFMRRVLKEQLNVVTLLAGYDNRFGHDRTEGFEDYVVYGRELGIDVIRAEALSVSGGAVSSSRIRQLLEQGDVSGASVCLGRFYELWGIVVHGEQIGRQIGFPTANISPDEARKQLPCDGVYAVLVSIEGHDGRLRGVMNIGRRPTFDGHRRTLEVHLLNFKGNLYGIHIGVCFIDRLRGERQFASAEELAMQMTSDSAAALRALESVQNSWEQVLNISK